MKEKLKKKKGIAACLRLQASLERVAAPGRYLVGRKCYVHVGSLLVGIPRIAGVTASRQ